MTITVYRSADGSAPVLTGQVGALVNLLDKCLVTGYGSQSAAGWAKPFTGTNKAVFRAATGNRLYLRVQDDAATNALSARVRGYETMSDVDTGSNLFPTATQLANGMAAFKSGTANSTARAWVLVADAQLFYLFMQAEGVTGEWHVLAFGDLDSYGTGDAYATILVASTDNASAATLDDNHFAALVQTLATQTNHYLARPYTAVAGAAACGKHSDALASTTIGAGLMTYPAPVDTGIHLAPIRVHEATTSRGVLPGVYAPLHSKPLTQGDTVTGVSGLSGRTLLVQDLASSTGTATGQCLIDTTGPWH